MYYENFKDARLVKIDKESWKKIQQAKDIYELNIKKKDLVTIPFVLTLKYPAPHTNFSFQFFKLQRIISNPKETVKFCIFSGGYYLLMGQHTGIKGTRGISAGGYRTDSDIFQLKQGMWVATNISNSPPLLVSFGIDGNIGDCRKIVSRLRERDSYLQRRGPRAIRDSFKTNGIIDPQLFKKQWIKMLLDSRRRLWKELGEKWLEDQNLKKFVKFKKTPTCLKVTAKSYNKHTYSIVINDFPIHQQNLRGGYYGDPEQLSFWLYFVHVRPADMQYYKVKPTDFHNRINTRFLDLFSLIEGCRDIIFQRDRVKAHITMKESLNGARRYKYNGVDIKRDDIRKRFEGEVQGIKWGGKTKRGKKGKVLSAEAQDLIANGLNGELIDLEGLYPFHLNVEYEKGKWYVAIAGKRFHVKGGLGALGTVRTAIKGNARVDSSCYDGEWLDGRDSRVILKRFKELLCTKDALWVIKQAKIMGAMMKAIQGK